MATFKQLKNYPKYELSGAVVRNFKTKAIIGAQKGIYRLYDETGDRVSISGQDLAKEPTIESAPVDVTKTTEVKTKIDQVLETAKAQTNEVKKDVKPKPEKGENKSDVIKKLMAEGKTKKEIIDATGYKPNTVHIVYNRLTKGGES